MKQDQLCISDPVVLLDTLREFSFLNDYNLSVYKEGDGHIAFRGDKGRMCGAFGENWLCVKDCQKVYQRQTEEAMLHSRPRIFRCPTGLLNFVIPFQSPQGESFQLLGGGVREKFIDLEHLEAISRDRKINGIYFLEQWETLPSVTRSDVQKVVDNIYGILPLLKNDDYYARVYEKTVHLINTITDLGPEIDQTRSVDDVINLLSETLTILFNVPRIALLFPQGSNRQLILKGLLGLDRTAVRLGEKSSSKLLGLKARRNLVMRGEQVKELFPYLDSDYLTCQPLAVDDRLVGFIALFDTELSGRDMMLIELLASRVAAKLVRLRRRRSREQETNRSTQVLEMISNLAQVGNTQQFNQTLLEMTADLLGATKGSLMLLDDSGKKLTIVASLGMNRQLALNMEIRVGQGIAGQVMATGAPLLVHDLEQARHLSVSRRPRFATRSFVSVPFQSEGRNLGVLSLSDKLSGTAFTDGDLQLLLKFLGHAGNLLQRATVLERAHLLEELSTSDALTGLYNRRFLNHRLEEELCRIGRQQLEFAVILLDLDHFKNYNDLGGHLAGDKALKKVAHLLRRSAREMDSVSRFGGEEFCIILPETGREAAKLVAERMRMAIEREPFLGEEQLPLGRLSISIGIARFPVDGDSPTALLNAADLALYQAKRKGRNRVQLFEPGMRKEKVVFL